MRVVQDVARGPHEDGFTDHEVRRGHLERAKPRPLFLQAHGGNDAGGAARAASVSLLLPLGELLEQVRVVEKAALLKKDPFTQPTRFSTAPFS